MILKDICPRIPNTLPRSPGHLEGPGRRSLWLGCHGQASPSPEVLLKGLLPSLKSRSQKSITKYDDQSLAAEQANTNILQPHFSFGNVALWSAKSSSLLYPLTELDDILMVNSQMVCLKLSEDVHMCKMLIILIMYKVDQEKNRPCLFSRVSVIAITHLQCAGAWFSAHLNLNLLQLYTYTFKMHIYCTPEYFGSAICSTAVIFKRQGLIKASRK